MSGDENRFLFTEFRNCDDEKSAVLAEFSTSTAEISKRLADFRGVRRGEAREARRQNKNTLGEAEGVMGECE